MRLSLCRHAQAIPATTDRLDEHRWLTCHGRERAAAVGELLRASGDVPDVILASPLVRAVQTAEGLARGTGFTGEIRVERALAPEGRLSVLLAAALRAPAGAHVLVVGHEPQMSSWGSSLLDRGDLPRPFGTACVLALEFEGPPEPGLGRARWFLDGDTGARLAF